MDKLLIIDALVEAGLIQLGYFIDEQTGDSKPLRLRLDLLPAYPSLLKDLSEMLAQKTNSAERLLCDADSLPLGVGVSLATAIPLVYSEGKELNPVHDLVGAYDVGHPTTLILNSYSDEQKIARLMSRATQVGLNVQQVSCVISMLPIQEKMEALLSVKEVTQHLVQKGLPEGQRESVLQWLTTLHPD